MLLMVLFILLADAALGRSDLCCQNWRGRDLFNKHEGRDMCCWRGIASEIAVGVGREGVEAGLGTEEARVDGAPATEAMDVDTTRQV